MPNGASPEPVTRDMTFEQMNALIAFRTIWIELAMWMREFVYSLVDNDPNQVAVTNRLYIGVPLKFYNAITVFYGPEIAEEFLGRISRFILRVWRLVDAIKNNRPDLVGDIAMSLQEGAIQNAAFMESVNPNWDRSTWNNFYIQYLRMLNEMILFIIGGEYENEIRVFDRLQNLSTLMGGNMARGIIQSRSRRETELTEPIESDQ
ncbi:MAG: hypothetical protein WCX60_03390 [Anaerovoracaceae bacterium]